VQVLNFLAKALVEKNKDSRIKIRIFLFTMVLNLLYYVAQTYMKIFGFTNKYDKKYYLCTRFLKKETYNEFC